MKDLIFVDESEQQKNNNKKNINLTRVHRKSRVLISRKRIGLRSAGRKPSRNPLEISLESRRRRESESDGISWQVGRRFELLAVGICFVLCVLFVFFFAFGKVLWGRLF